MLEISNFMYKLLEIANDLNKMLSIYNSKIMYSVQDVKNI